MIDILVNLYVFTIMTSDIMSIFVKAPLFTCASMSTEFIEKEWLGLRVYAFWISIHSLKMHMRKAVQMYSPGDIVLEYNFLE
jgi:hypothetical protein